MLKITSFVFALLFVIIIKTSGQIPAITNNNGRHALLVDGKPFLILGAQAHNSSGWPSLLPNVWQSAEYMHLNTLEVPLYWEQIEPTEGKFDFSILDTLLTQARAHNMHLVLLWFATWKNGSNHYMPEWMKKDAVKYPNIMGKDGKPVDSPSPHSEATLQSDSKAFATVMRYLKKADPQYTVIMVQVENESGAWGSVRDYSSQAQRLFESSVPAELLKPAILKELNVPVVPGGSWKQVFGDRGDEYFHAWFVAHFIGAVAAAGKKEYPLPMYVNAALRNPLTNPPATQYESGGPTDNVIPIWKEAAPAIDLIAPDIYLPGNEQVLKVLDLYSRNDNALFVPEAGLKAVNAKYFYEVLSRGGIGFSPFGIDNNGDTAKQAKMAERLAPFAQVYVTAAPMMRELADWSWEGKIKSVVEGDDHAAQTVNLRNWQCTVSFGGNGRTNAAPAYDEPTGNAAFVQLADNTFLITGLRCHIRFQPSGKEEGKAWQYGKVEEGKYTNGVFTPIRILNGDETDWGGPGFGTTPVVLKVTVLTR